jgi:hypothetical protein
MDAARSVTAASAWTGWTGPRSKRARSRQAHSPSTEKGALDPYSLYAGDPARDLVQVAFGLLPRAIIGVAFPDTP